MIDDDKEVLDLEDPAEPDASEEDEFDPVEDNGAKLEREEW